MEITKDTLVTVGDKKVSMGTLAQMFPSMGLGTPVIPAGPAKPNRRIVTTPTRAPAGADDLTRAALALKSAAAPLPTVVAASSKTFADVTITITREAVILKEGEAAQDMLVLCKRYPSPGGKDKPRKGEPMPHYNYRFDKGFCYWNTKGAEPAKPSWKWDDNRGVRFVPVEALETLLQGLRETYVGARLIMGDKSFTL